MSPAPQFSSVNLRLLGIRSVRSNEAAENANPTPAIDPKGREDLVNDPIYGTIPRWLSEEFKNSKG
jgi:hypothetical protein